MKIILIVETEEGKKIQRQWSPRNNSEYQRRKEYIGRMLNEIEQENETHKDKESL